METPAPRHEKSRKTIVRAVVLLAAINWPLGWLMILALRGSETFWLQAVNDLSLTEVLAVVHG
jgi:hypothetical protein